MDIPFDVLNIVASFIVKPKMKLLDWIPLDKLDVNTLSANKGAINFLERHPEIIKWDYLSFNENAIHMLEAHPEKINWENLLANPNAMTLYEKFSENPFVSPFYDRKFDIFFAENDKPLDLIEALFDKLILSYTVEASINFLKKLNLIEVDPVNHKKITKFISDYRSYFVDEDFSIDYYETNWNTLSMSSKILDIVEEHPDIINMAWLSADCNSERAFKLLEKHSERIKWNYLSSNPYPPAFALLETVLQHDPDKIDWGALSINCSAIHLLEKRHNDPLSEIDWTRLSINSGIFEIDTKQLNIDMINKAHNFDCI
jgi:hypothetical protein